MLSRYAISYAGGELRLVEESTADLREALAVLINSPGVSIEDSSLTPCFDEDELRRRNNAKE